MQNNIFKLKLHTISNTYLLYRDEKNNVYMFLAFDRNNILLIGMLKFLPFIS